MLALPERNKRQAVQFTTPHEAGVSPAAGDPGAPATAPAVAGEFWQLDFQLQVNLSVFSSIHIEVIKSKLFLTKPLYYYFIYSIGQSLFVKLHVCKLIIFIFQISKKLLNKGNNLATLWEQTKDELEVLASKEVLALLLESSHSYDILSIPKAAHLFPDHSDDKHQWPEYQVGITIL